MRATSVFSDARNGKDARLGGTIPPRPGKPDTAAKSDEQSGSVTVLAMNPSAGRGEATRRTK